MMGSSAETQKIPFVYEDAGSVVGGLSDENGWQLVGVGGEEDVVVDRVIAAWTWSNGHWTSLEINDGKVSLEAGRGYFIFRE